MFLGWSARHEVIFIPHHTMVAGYYGFTLDIHVSVCPSSNLLHFGPSIFYFQMMSKYQWIFARLGMYIDIVKIWFRIANRQILSVLDSYNVSAGLTSVFSFLDNNLSKCQ